MKCSHTWRDSISCDILMNLLSRHSSIINTTTGSGKEIILGHDNGLHFVMEIAKLLVSPAWLSFSLSSSQWWFCDHAQLSVIKRLGLQWRVYLWIMVVSDRDVLNQGIPGVKRDKIEVNRNWFFRPISPSQIGHLVCPIPISIFDHLDWPIFTCNETILLKLGVLSIRKRERQRECECIWIHQRYLYTEHIRNLSKKHASIVTSGMWYGINMPLSIWSNIFNITVAYPIDGKTAPQHQPHVVVKCKV